MQLLPLVSLIAGLRYVVMLNLGSSCKDTSGFIFVHGVFFYLLHMKIPPPTPITERTSVLIFSLLLHFSFIRLWFF